MYPVEKHYAERASRVAVCGLFCGQTASCWLRSRWLACGCCVAVTSGGACFGIKISRPAAAQRHLLQPPHFPPRLFPCLVSAALGRPADSDPVSTFLLCRSLALVPIQMREGRRLPILPGEVTAPAIFPCTFRLRGRAPLAIVSAKNSIATTVFASTSTTPRWGSYPSSCR
jgi:hypothetical protein